MNDRRQRRHHFVPRMHLRRFASPEKKVVQLDIESGRRRPVSVTDAAVIRDFYTVTVPDGTKTDAWERWLGDLESDMAPALEQAIAAPVFRLTPDDRWRLARWIALQFLRGPDHRRQLAEVGALVVSAQVGMGGIAYLRHAMSLSLGHEVSLATAEAVWNDITSLNGPVIEMPSNEHLDMLSRAFDRATAVIYARSWSRVRFRRRKLILADVPVGLIPDGEGPMQKSGLAGARVLTVPLDRHNLLWLETTEGSEPASDRDIEPTSLLAWTHNMAAVASAERFVYHHPNDDPVPADVEFPRPRPNRVSVTGMRDFANRERPLEDVLKQIAEHPEGESTSLIANYTWPIAGYRPRHVPPLPEQ